MKEQEAKEACDPKILAVQTAAIAHMFVDELEEFGKN